MSCLFLDQTEPIVDTGSCMKGNGRGYSGNQIRTTTNNLCQVWSVQSPHAHPMLPSIYTSELVNAGYSCRNPGGLGERPWCYTNYKYMRWEYCDIPQCGKLPSVSLTYARIRIGSLVIIVCGQIVIYDFIVLWFHLQGYC